jgi:2-polyprenyl-3-methyl-5-hydroxy-6-metoxy-1,4-benzoquinol methylase
MKMKDFLIRTFGRDKMKKLFFKVQVLLNSKYRKSFYECKRKFREINDKNKEELHKCLSDNCFSQEYLNTDIGKKDMEDHMVNRIFDFRHRTIPWINSLISLGQAKILEIGCGTGCTTVALAEQGCELTSIDVNTDTIKVAKKRCELYNLQVNISAMNAININELNTKFDLILFSASLEHMTYGNL